MKADEIRNMDEIIGAKLKARRKLSGFSAQQFASALGISYQQLYKYENGSNRISATQLSKIAKVLNVDVQFFFSDSLLPFAQPQTNSYRAAQLLDEPETQNLLKGYISISDPRVRSAIGELVTSITKYFAKRAASYGS